jgi:Ca2+-binding RTX toxin-like protein
LFEAGSGNDTLLAGPGSATLTGAIGSSAAALLVSGASGPTTFSFVSGQSGGADTISGFKANDVLSFTGYGNNLQISHPTGITLITLNDGTRITIAGATPTSGQIRTS